MEGLLPPGSDKGMSLQKVTNDRRRKRSQKNVAKRDERRERLLKQEANLRKQREEQEVTQKETQLQLAALE